MKDVNYFSGTTSKPDASGDLSEEEQRGLERLKDFRSVNICFLSAEIRLDTL